ncbi:MAG: mandelate racemase/muconate lactonizing enzyme family protein [Phycisphaeraceae bacterium]|nr:mandelate racemase/muconate lactonizing enzyme family protein [Phycisphaeraceae bacterium]
MPSNSSDVKITDVQTTLLTGPCTNDPFLLECRKRRSAAFIEVFTDSDLVGIGETYGGYYCPELVPATVDLYKPILIGRTVGNIEQIWQDMYHCENFWGRVGLGPIVLSGIDAALWDLKGKITGLPVYELLGGRKHDSLLGYATGGPSNYPKDRLAAKLDHYASLGFRAVKLGSGGLQDGRDIPLQGIAAAVDFEADKLQFVREHVGMDYAVLLDGHMGNRPGKVWDVAIAQAVMKAVEPFDLFLFEEPLHYTNPWGYAELCKSTTIPIAGGECLTGMYEWQVYVDRDCFDIGQPDAAFSGGPGTFMKIAAMLEGHRRQVATHSWGAGGGFMQNIHAGFAAANTVILEIAPDYGPLHSEVIGDSFIFRDGMVYPPQKPGLGIELTDETRNRFPFVSGSGEYNNVPGKVMVE